MYIYERDVSVEKAKITCQRKPCLDVETRWNSTFLMLETAEKFEAAFDRYLLNMLSLFKLKYGILFLL